jgi:hypothetical protein
MNVLFLFPALALAPVPPAAPSRGPPPPDLRVKSAPGPVAPIGPLFKMPPQPSPALAAVEARLEAVYARVMGVALLVCQPPRDNTRDKAENERLNGLMPRVAALLGDQRTALVLGNGMLNPNNISMGCPPAEEIAARLDRVAQAIADLQTAVIEAERANPAAPAASKGE